MHGMNNIKSATTNSVT